MDPSLESGIVRTDPDPNVMLANFPTAPFNVALNCREARATDIYCYFTTAL